MVKSDSQSARILRVLADGNWHTSARILRRAGVSRLNSRISDLRRHGYEIEHERVPGRSGELGHRYRLLDGPAVPATQESNERVVLDRDSVPRTPEHRFRCYRQRYDELELVATAATPAALGERIVALGLDGQFVGSVLGVLDTHGRDDEPGTWLVDPFKFDPDRV